MTGNLDFSQENLDDTFKEYGPLLCSSCKAKMSYYAEPIRERLHRGLPPTIRQITRLTSCLCRECHAKIVMQKLKKGGDE